MFCIKSYFDCQVLTTVCPCYDWTGAYGMAAVYNFEDHDILDVYIA